MIIVEVMIQKVYPGKWDTLTEIDKKFDAVEKRHGFPATKRMQSISGAYGLDTNVVMREWESMAAFEAAYESMFTDSEHEALVEEVGSIIESSRMELYSPR
jgi:heme-degrading monooxygenase HmoA